MEYKNLKLSTLNLNKPIESKNVTFIWGNDGWCYIPELTKRQRFSVVGEFLEMEQERQLVYQVVHIEII